MGCHENAFVMLHKLSDNSSAFNPRWRLHLFPHIVMQSIKYQNRFPSLTFIASFVFICATAPSKAIIEVPACVGNHVLGNEIRDGDYFSRCVVNQTISNQAHVWNFTKSNFQHSTFFNITFFIHNQLTPFTDTVLFYVTFSNCTFKSARLNYAGLQLTSSLHFEKVTFLDVRFVDTVFHETINLHFYRFRMENMEFSYVELYGYILFCKGVMNKMTMH